MGVISLLAMIYLFDIRPLEYDFIFDRTSEMINLKKCD